MFAHSSEAFFAAILPGPLQMVRVDPLTYDVKVSDLLPSTVLEAFARASIPCYDFEVGVKVL